MKIRSLIVPIDFTDTAKNTADYAVKLAEIIESKIIFVSSYMANSAPNAGATMSTMMHPAPENVVSLEKLHKEKLDDFLKSTLPLSVNHKAITRIGTQAEVVCTIAEEEKAELILVGSESTTGMEAFFVGSESEKITRKAPCSVLALPKDSKHFKMDTIGLALDTDNDENNGNLSVLKEIVVSTKAKLRLVHISDKEEIAFKTENVLNHYKTELNSVEHSFHVFFENDTEKGISKFLDKNPIDLMAILYREHGFFERLFQPGLRKKLIFENQIPLLVLK
ncbi:MAG: universal stress protein [Maribacter litoralis]|uniref:universal stress protein n=1 Tax=Maribacter litoralis TaxID=2059726 RepID=UPI0032967E47